MASLLHSAVWPILVLLATPATRPVESPPVPAVPDLSGAPLVMVLGIDDANQVTVQRQDDLRMQVRLACVKPPADEARQAAMVFLRNLLVGEKVWLVSAASGTEGEAGWYVYRCPDRLFVNLEVIRQGYADVLASPSDRSDTVKALTYWRDQARHTNRGIWAIASPARAAGPQAFVRPARVEPIRQGDTKANAAREPVDSGATVVHVSSSSSGKKYHRADCRSLRSGSKPLPLNEARKRYEPCKLCKPPQ